MKTKSSEYAEFVWFDGKVWFNPQNPSDHRGQISLWSVKNDGKGILAEPSRVRDCTVDEIEAIKYFQGRTRNHDLDRVSFCLSEQISWFQNQAEDPYGIANAVITALRCVQESINKANRF